MRKTGFTLIELLVVIAIIGILASVVLASVTVVRDRGVDAAIKSTLNNTRSQAQIFYEDNGGAYTTVCSTGTGNISTLVAGAGSAGSASVMCADTTDAWALQAQLRTTTDYYCVDNMGNALITAASSIADGSDYLCGP